MQVLAILTLIFVVGWFAAIGASRAGWTKAILWAVAGGVIWAIGFYLAARITEELLLLAGPAIALNGVFVLSTLVGIVAGVVLCYLFYWLIRKREERLAAATYADMGTLNTAGTLHMSSAPITPNRTGPVSDQ